MNLKFEQAADALTVYVEGSIDTVTAPKFESELSQHCGGITELHIDMAQVDYVSSAGLRALANANQMMGASGKMTLKNVNGDVREVFEMTGFDELLTIE